MIVTVQGRNVMVTAYPYAGSVRTLVSLAGGEEPLTGDIQTVCDMARELDAAWRCLGAVRSFIEGESGVERWHLDA